MKWKLYVENIFGNSETDFISNNIK